MLQSLCQTGSRWISSFPVRIFVALLQGQLLQTGYKLHMAVFFTVQILKNLINPDGENYKNFSIRKTRLL
jgi:hypothetical protein